MIQVRRIFHSIDRLITPEWLPTWTLSALALSLIFAYVLSSVGSPLQEKTGQTLAHLQISGSYPLLKWTPWGKDRAEDILKNWKEKGALSDARRAQKIDFFFPFAYGTFFLLFSIGMWRCHPKYPRGGKWVWCLALGTVAAALDEVENIFMCLMLSFGGGPAQVFSVFASLFAIPKLLLLCLVVPVIFLLALRRARG